MQEITLSLSDGQLARLREIAQQLALTPEQAAAELLGEQLAASARTQADAPAQLASALDLSGLVDDPTIAPLTAAELDGFLGSEALNPHNDHGE